MIFRHTLYVSVLVMLQRINQPQKKCIKSLYVKIGSTAVPVLPVSSSKQDIELILSSQLGDLLHETSLAHTSLATENPTRVRRW